MKPPKHEIPIDPDGTYFAQIGELAVRWGWIENQVGVLIRELLRVSKPEGLMMIGNLGIKPKTRVLAALAEHSFNRNALRNELVALADAVQAFDGFRNDVLHGLWVHSPKGSRQLALLRRKSLEQQINPHPDKDVLSQLVPRIAELRALQVDAQRLTRALKALHGKFE